MSEALRALGIPIAADEADERFVVDSGDGRFPRPRATLFIGNAGTAARFLTAAVAIGHGRYVIDGVERMRRRPIEPLLDGLQQLGVDAAPPTTTAVRRWWSPRPASRHGRARVRGDISAST
ncbi:MAG: hypothetical protein U0531_07880 [Dehalococcoidia bacterium]